MLDMVKVRFFIGILVILYGTVSIFAVGCKKQELAKLTITIEGKELSDAQIYADEKYVGSLTQTIIAADGGVYIDGKLAARLHSHDNGHSTDFYTGCSDPILLASGKHTIVLQKSDAQPLKVVLNISSGYHLLTIVPEKGLVKWDQKTIQIDSSNTVVDTFEKNK